MDEKGGGKIKKLWWIETIKNYGRRARMSLETKILKSEVKQNAICCLKVPHLKVRNDKLINDNLLINCCSECRWDLINPTRSGLLLSFLKNIL